ncbi:phenylacetone monooxygenase protein [Colletotrichum incanum]|uniref:Phenylacetone monooxygenase protein n=1 Tax=Colletotrichum incanum TaxID=1573173 RepID=A0A162NGA2_COLIC|nr:phenylacetone monooxygenase protein [Colletotrichum incanum]
MSTAELRKIYDDERQKGLNPEGMNQYIDFRDPEIGDKLGPDPWVNYDDVLANGTSLKDGSTTKFTIIGAGHAGLLYAVRLIDAGFKAEHIVLVDTAGGFGGTWYWNRYPGLMCDVEGYIYMPLLEETGYVPKNKYSYGAEIRGQCERIAAHYQLRGQFCTRLPGIRELMENKKIFHSARWDWQYTGGSQAQPNMIHLREKKVGHLYVFQRTPSYVGPRNQRETTPEEWKKVAYRQGWQYQRQDNFNHFVSNDPVPNNLINDGWTAPDSHSVAGFIGKRLRAHIANMVKDEDIAKKLQPWYAGWCKRPAFHDDYLASFNLPNVTLVDTDGKGVDYFTASGVVANGDLYDLDVVVLATGFTSPGKTPSPTGHLNAPIIGRNGVDSSQKWGSQDYGTFYGGGVSYNLTSAYDVAAKFVANVIAVAHKEAGSASNLLTVEATKEAEDRYTNEVQKRSLWFTALATCTPGWFNGEADGALRKQTPEEQAARLRQVPWGSGILDFKKMVSRYISEGTLEGFEISS